MVFVLEELMKGGFDEERGGERIPTLITKIAILRICNPYVKIGRNLTSRKKNYFFN